MANDMLVRAVPILAHALAAHAVQKNRVRVTERDDVQPIAAEVLKGIAEGQTEPVQVRTAVQLDYPSEWPKLGPIDISLSDQSGTVCLELKSGSDVNALGPCVWDVVKCAFALRHGQALQAYLLAASTCDLWQQPIRGAEFFTTEQEWTVTKLRSAYKDWWRKWEREGYAPRRVPAECTTGLVATAQCEISGNEWEIRLARVWSKGVEWYEWEGFGAS